MILKPYMSDFENSYPINLAKLKVNDLAFSRKCQGIFKTLFTGIWLL